MTDDVEEQAHTLAHIKCHCYQENAECCPHARNMGWKCVKKSAAIAEAIHAYGDQRAREALSYAIVRVAELHGHPLQEVVAGIEELLSHENKNG